MRLYRACQEPSWLTWDPGDIQRDDFPMTRHFWSEAQQQVTYAALCAELTSRGMTTAPTRTYANDRGAFGVLLPTGVVDFPGTYKALSNMVDEFELGERFVNVDIPRGVARYGESVPVLHMMGTTVPEWDDEITALIAQGTSPMPREQQVVYVLSEEYRERLIPRVIGSMHVSALEVAYGSLAGAIHSDRRYLVPPYLSADEQASFRTSHDNWELQRDEILRHLPFARGTI